MNESARDFWEKTASRYDRVTKGLLGRPLPRAVELTAGAVAGAGIRGPIPIAFVEAVLLPIERW